MSHQGSVEVAYMAVRDISVIRLIDLTSKWPHRRRFLEKSFCRKKFSPPNYSSGHSMP